jgi:diguanylate cyclase (GGDEF)-like protein/PAS domain S-box-containing protein
MLTDAVEDWGPRTVTAEELPCGEDFFRRLIDNLYDGVYFVDLRRKILAWNLGAERLTGYAAKDVLGSYCYANILDHADENGCQLCEGFCPLVYTVDTGLPASKRVFLRHKDGRRIAVDVHVMPMRNDQGEIIGGVEVFRDASRLVALETAYSKLREVAEKDPLTGVANRRYLDRMLESQVDLLDRTGIPLSIILADVDYLKQINDTCGHCAGDRALTAFAEQLLQTCRRTDAVGRLGGDEFLAILPEQALDSALAMAERLRAAVADVAADELCEWQLTGSFGVAEAVLGDTPASILKRADEALYRAKALGRNRVESCQQSSLVALAEV